MIGTDIVYIPRIELKESFIKYVLTEDEYQEYCLINNDKRRKEYIAGRFASKEAIFKATQDKDYLSYSILHEDNGRPYVKDHPEIQISISHDGDYAIAVVVII
jgi:holo-[acyl-carrier protein] synthase